MLLKFKMENNTVAFAFLDSSYLIPQHLQMLSFKNYATNNGLDIAFYGGELVGQEQHHLLFRSYLKDDCYNHFLFFSVRQFITPENFLQIELIELAIQQKKSLHFANENRFIESNNDVNKLILLTLTLNGQLWKNWPNDFTFKP